MDSPQTQTPTAPRPIEIPRANRLASAAPGEIRLGTRTYLVPQALEQDLAAFGEAAIKIVARRRNARMLELFRELRDLELSRALLADEEKSERRAFDALTAAANDGRPMEDSAYDFHRAAMTADGAAFLLWVMARRVEPGLVLEEVRKEVTEETAPALGLELLVACGLKGADPNSVGGTGTP